jgi:hypothetical protein
MIGEEVWGIVLAVLFLVGVSIIGTYFLKERADVVLS